MYSCSGQLSSLEIDLISKELNCPEHEYMNMASSLIELATPQISNLPTVEHLRDGRTPHKP